MYKKFKALLVETVNESMENQKRKLEERLAEWMGNYEQDDDIVIFGVEIDWSVNNSLEATTLKVNKGCRKMSWRIGWNNI